MKSYKPDLVIIDELSLNDQITINVLEKFPQIQYEILKQGKSIQGTASEQYGISSSKRILSLKRNQGKFIERCPGTKEHLCCNYYVANLAVNCHFECTYCFLQSYLNDHNITVYTNIDDFLQEVRGLEFGNGDRKLRIGTGELADSLALDELTGFTGTLVPYFEGQEKVILELKTKGNYIDGLLNTTPNENTVIAWSLNPQNLVETEEIKCSSLQQRLEAAEKCIKHGYSTAFHFDPIILHENWENNYTETIDMLFEIIPSEKVNWISLGVLRFNTAGKSMIQKRFPKTNIIYEEMIKCADGKYRYPQPIRTKIYGLLLERIRKYTENAYVYLCMESTAVWERVFGSNEEPINELNYF